MIYMLFYINGELMDFSNLKEMTQRAGFNYIERMHSQAQKECEAFSDALSSDSNLSFGMRTISFGKGLFLDVSYRIERVAVFAVLTATVSLSIVLIPLELLVSTVTLRSVDKIIFAANNLFSIVANQDIVISGTISSLFHPAGFDSNGEQYSSLKIKEPEIDSNLTSSPNSQETLKQAIAEGNLQVVQELLLSKDGTLNIHEALLLAMDSQYDEIVEALVKIELPDSISIYKKALEKGYDDIARKIFYKQSVLYMVSFYLRPAISLGRIDFAQDIIAHIKSKSMVDRVRAFEIVCRDNCRPLINALTENMPEGSLKSFACAAARADNAEVIEEFYQTHKFSQEIKEELIAVAVAFKAGNVLKFLGNVLNCTLSKLSFNQVIRFAIQTNDLELLKRWMVPTVGTPSFYMSAISHSTSYEVIKFLLDHKEVPKKELITQCISEFSIDLLDPKEKSKNDMNPNMGLALEPEGPNKEHIREVLKLIAEHLAAKNVKSARLDLIKDIFNQGGALEQIEKGIKLEADANYILAKFKESRRRAIKQACSLNNVYVMKRLLETDISFEEVNNALKTVSQNLLNQEVLQVIKDKISEFSYRTRLSHMLASSLSI